MAGAKKRNAKRKRPMGRKKRSTKDIILRAIQYVSACLCVVFLAILIKNISDDMVSYEIQWENEQRLNALLSSPTATGNLFASQTPPALAASPTLAPTPTAAAPTSSPTPDGLFAAFFSTPAPTATVAPLATPAETAEQATAVPAASPSPTPNMDSRFTKYQNPPPALQQKFMTSDFYYANPSFVGFLQAGVSVVEPVVYSNDNEYYLTHNFNNEEDAAGAAFMDMRCSLWPRSQQIVIHGHNMKNKTVFGSLDDMGDIDNLKQYPTVQFDTIYEDGTYVVFAAFNASMNTDESSYFDVARYDFATEAEFQAYLDEVLERSMYDIPVDVSYEDELLTLVTCSYHQDNGRFLLFTRKLRANETAESVSALVAQAEQIRDY